MILGRGPSLRRSPPQAQVSSLTGCSAQWGLPHTSGLENREHPATTRGLRELRLKTQPPNIALSRDMRHLSCLS
jgi:hypothetical protein